MPLIFVFIGGLFMPRVTIVLLWLLTSWFSGVFTSILWPIIGFIFMPFTLLWYSVVVNLFGGVWGPISLVGLIIAILVDLSSHTYGYRTYTTHTHVVEHTEEVL